MDKERIQKALDSLVYLPHLKEKALHTTVSPVGKDAGGKGRVWDRGDLFRRLHTYKPATWFCKPEAISPVECARRGWLNTAPDMLSCEFCKAKVSCPIPPELLPEAAAEMATRYAKLLSEAHDAACPWRTHSCAASLLQFPPLTQEAAQEDFRARSASLQRLLCLPPLAGRALDRMAAGRQAALERLLLHGPGPLPVPQQQGQQQGQQPEEGQGGPSEADPAGAVSGELRSRLCEGVATWNADAYEARLRLLALCGWDLRVVSAAGGGSSSSSGGGGGGEGRGQEGAGEAVAVPGGVGRGSGEGSHVGPECSALACALCGARAGLWSFFPRCRPQVQARPGAGAGGASKAGLSGRAATTIAGGSFGGSSLGATAAPAGGAPAGPFGGPASAAVPLFGPPSLPQPSRSGSLPPSRGREGSPGAVAVAGSAPNEPAAAVPSGVDPASGSSSPAGGADALGGSREGAKRKQPAAGGPGQADGGGAAAAAGPADKRSRAGAGASAAEACAPPQQYCSSEALQRYQDMEALPLDPLALHRGFCPWVHQARAAQGAARAAQHAQQARCGWAWCLQQLVPGAEDGGGLWALGSGEGKQYDPAKLLRAVLRRVDVHK